MFQYWYSIYDCYGVDVTALAIFTGNTHQKRPSQFYKSYLDTKNLLIAKKFTIAEIANFTTVTETFVKKVRVRAELNK